MWINNALSKEISAEPIHKAIVTNICGNKITAVSHIKAMEVNVMSFGGIYWFPKIGDEVILAPMANGEYIAIGTIINNSTDKLCLNMGKSNISLCKDGNITINNLTIDLQGNLTKGNL